MQHNYIDENKGLIRSQNLVISKDFFYHFFKFEIKRWFSRYKTRVLFLQFFEFIDAISNHPMKPGLIRVWLSANGLWHDQTKRVAIIHSPMWRISHRYNYMDLKNWLQALMMNNLVEIRNFHHHNRGPSRVSTIQFYFHLVLAPSPP